jgi:hypothetical protein
MPAAQKERHSQTRMSERAACRKTSAADESAHDFSVEYDAFGGGADEVSAGESAVGSVSREDGAYISATGATYLMRLDALAPYGLACESVLYQAPC